MQLLRGYNQNHPKPWDENLIYIQHSYNKGVDTSIRKSPFETCFVYFPPSPLDVVYGKKWWVREHTIGEALRAEKFIVKTRQIHLQIYETLKKSHEKYNARHDQHREEKSFKARDSIWLQRNNEWLQGPSKEIKALRYDSFEVLKRVRDNS